LKEGAREGGKEYWMGGGGASKISTSFEIKPS